MIAELSLLFALATGHGTGGMRDAFMASGNAVEIHEMQRHRRRPASPEEAVPAARGVLERTLHGGASLFDLAEIPSENGLDVFEYEAHRGRVHVSGSSAVAICRGAYEYLKGACHCQVSWSGDNLDLPARMPDHPLVRVVCPNRYRHYFNVCTFGYTMVWWNWNRWQKEIDWMALHGINMPLAMTGQEKVWQQVFRSLGESNASIQAHFTGPAFLPWHRMGNIDNHMGPLPQSWIDGQAELQNRILRRERELGMTPVVPGFSGFVPVDFNRVHRDVPLFSPTPWAGFAATKFVDPRSPMFADIGAKFVTAYRKEFGSDHLYLCDTFNEMNPQFPAETELSDLASTGRSIYEGIRRADPDGVWVMQGWLFYNEHDYWTPARSEAMLGDVPDGHLIVLDLATNEHSIWNEQPVVKRKGWIYNTLHNYGQTTNLYGDLQGYADTAYGNLSNPDHGEMLGMGMTPEGIDQNPVVYELLTDAMWTAQPIDVKSWLMGYTLSRYGSKAIDSRDGLIVRGSAFTAWLELLESVYGRGGGSRSTWRYRPTGRVDGEGFDPVIVLRAARNLLAAAPQLAGKNLYERDLVDITKTWLGSVADRELSAALVSFDGDRPAYQLHRKRFFQVLHDLDRLMATRPEHRLSTWIEDARSWGRSPREKDLCERNARMQVTVWGGPELFDYANKEWAGLNEDFIRGRWELFFGALDSASSLKTMKMPDFAKWELGWALSTRPIAESKPEDPIKVCSEVLRGWGP